MKMIAGTLELNGNEIYPNWCFLGIEIRELYSNSVKNEDGRQMESIFDEEMGKNSEKKI